MAHPLAQQPPFALGLPFPPRPSPLAFPFAHSPAAAKQPARKRPPPPTEPLKRPRSPSPSPASPPPTAKRTRLPPRQEPDDDVDVGILLATLQPSAHLPILLQLLAASPALAPAVLAMIPSPDSRACAEELERKVAHIDKLVGPVQPSSFQSGSLSEIRRWDRVAKLVQGYCRIATTYIRYLTSAAQNPAPDAQSVFAFLRPVTLHAIAVLALIPSSSSMDQPPPPASAVLDLAKLILATWSSWVSDLSSRVNDHGEMHPHSIVALWADTLDHLATGPAQSAATLPVTTHWSSSTPTPAQDSREHPLVVSFREAMLPIRDQFVGQMGWLIGRQRVPMEL